MKAETLEINLKALLARVNRHLSQRDEIVKVSRSKVERERSAFYVVNTAKGSITDTFDDFEAWTRGKYPDLIKPYERLAG
jgi:hypothetical protein